MPRNYRTKAFRKLFDDLPKQIQELAQLTFKEFVKDPASTGLRHHQLTPCKLGKHIEPSWSVSLNMQYRAIYTVVNGANAWYWIGSHAAYDVFIGRK
jgi:hypothetical protein